MPLLNPTQINDILQSFLDVACNCLEDSPLGVPADCYISHNEPPDDCCDFLAIWLERIRPRIGFENAAYITGEKVWAKCGDVGGVADIQIRLMRPCFPTLKDNATNPFPPAIEMQTAAENLLIDLQLLRCCIQEANCMGILFPTTDGAECLELAIGDAVPEGPRGGCAGWSLSYGFELDSCWYGPDGSS
jgi:hypothetical protein